MRNFVTLLLLLTFVLSAVSGVVLFIRPEGSLARWVGWSALGLEKKQWEAVHTAFVLALTIISAVHLWYNWKPLVAYLKLRAPALLVSRRRMLPAIELVAALGVAALIWAGAVSNWPPFSNVVALRSAMKDGVYLVMAPPPLPEAERLAVSDICRHLAIPEQQALANARQRGIIISDTSVTIAVIAAEHDVTPEEVYQALLGDHNQGTARP